MKNLSLCDSIERILISEKINCDAIVISDESLQYSLLYHSKELKTFTESILKTLGFHLIRKKCIKNLQNLFDNHNINLSTKGLTSTLNDANRLYLILKIYSEWKTYNKEREKYNTLNNDHYIRFYSTRSNVYIWLNKDLLNEAFNDTIQSSIKSSELEGIYVSKDGNYQLRIYVDPFDGQAHIQNRQACEEST